MNSLSLDTKAVGFKRRGVQAIMLHVMAALTPGIILYALLIDSRLIVNLIVASFFAIAFESLFIYLRKRPVLPALSDGSIVLAAVLLVLCIPQSLPTWQLVFGVFTLCVLGKHIFGGLGHNPFNPAMVAYAVLIVSFPLTMTQWSSEQGFLDQAKTLPQNASTAVAIDYDGISSATPLDRLATIKRLEKPSTISESSNNGEAGTSNTQPAQENSVADSTNAASAIDSAASVNSTELIMQSDWFWLSVCWLIGGFYLLLLRIVSWHIPITMLGTIWLIYAVYGGLSSAHTLNPTTALFSGAIMLGAFFIATDPVSGATSRYGRIVYAFGIGVFTFFIREFSDYPEGVAFAVLLMNTCVPLIDHAFTRKQPQAFQPGPAPENNERSP